MNKNSFRKCAKSKLVSEISYCRRLNTAAVVFYHTDLVDVVATTSLLVPEILFLGCSVRLLCLQLLATAVTFLRSCYADAEPSRWTLSLAARFGVILRLQ